MSKKALKKYLSELSKEQLEEQILVLYNRLKEVKQFYDFVFNPNEKKKIEECKFKIHNEYFPISGRKPKKRRSVAQKFIKTFIKLGVEPSLIAEIMLFNLETAIRYSADNQVKQESFFVSIHRSYIDAQNYIQVNGLISSFQDNLQKVKEEIWNQNWFNKEAFD